jgi:hypothetical protein
MLYIVRIETRQYDAIGVFAETKIEVEAENSRAAIAAAINEAHAGRLECRNCTGVFVREGDQLKRVL